MVPRFVTLTLLPMLLLGQQSVPQLLQAKLLERIQQFDRQMDGVLGVAAIDLSSGEEFSYRGDTLFPTASSIKIPILFELFRLRAEKKLDFDEKITLQPKDLVGGSGVIQTTLKNGPVTLSVRELIHEMIVSSDNVATNWCIRRAGLAEINANSTRLGFPRTRLQRLMIDLPAALRNEENISTPVELARMVRRLYQGQIVSPEASQEMLGIMKQVKANMRKAIPAEIVVASKPGGLTGVSCEAGVVYLANRPFAVTVMGTFLPNGQSPVEPVTRLIYEHFLKLSQGNIYGNLGVR